MKITFKTALTFLAIALLLFIGAGCSSTSSHQSSDTASDSAASGSIVIEETQAMLIIGGSYGGGTLNFQGDSYPFKARGLKLGGIGIHKIHLTGDVYKLEEAEDFSGTYFTAEAGITVGKGVGGFWLQNSQGVTIHLKASAEGLALAIGIEGMELTLN
jgi:hypothetical protein